MSFCAACGYPFEDRACPSCGGQVAKARSSGPRAPARRRWLGPLSPAGEAFLLRRGLRPSEIEDVQAGSLGDRAGHVIFPLLQDGEPTGLWHGRRIFPGEPRWISPPGMPASAIWGLDHVLPGGPCAICEGIFDALALRERGGAAIMRAAPTLAQLKILLDRGPSRVYLAMDADLPEALVRRTMRRIRMLDRSLPVELLPPPAGLKDWGETLPLRP